MNDVPIILSAQDVEEQTRKIDVLTVMRHMFAALGEGSAAQPPQTLTLFPGGSGDFITYPGVLATAKVFGAKLSPYIEGSAGAPSLVTAWTLLMSMETGCPLLLCDAKALTIERTAATTALAVDLLAPRACSRLAIVGTGPVARAHLRHVRSLREWREIRIYSPRMATSPELHTLLRALEDRVRLEPNLASAARNAEVILLCTSSGTPVLDPAHLQEPALITSISTNAPRAHEVPPSALVAMDVYCDYRVTTPANAGEMQLAAENGWSPDAILGDLPELVLGKAKMPEYNRHTYFRSIGLGLEDIAVAEAVYREFLKGPARNSSTSI
jgi:L-arginine dehydrogenase